LTSQVDDAFGATLEKIFVLSGGNRAKLLRAFPKSPISELPNFARACGRVSVGGHPDKRPDSRPDRDRDGRKVAGSPEFRTLD
jgi:hypothetical protein